MKPLLLLHAPPDTARASEVAALLDALGYAVRAESCGVVNTRERRRLAAAARTTPQVLVLWSRAATPSLRATALAAHRTRKLAFARLDATAPPARLGALAVSVPRGRAQGQALRRLLEDAVMTSVEPERPTAGKTSRIAALFTLAAMGLVTASAAYAVNPSFAAQVDAIAGKAQAQTMALVHSVGH